MLKLLDYDWQQPVRDNGGWLDDIVEDDVELRHAKLTRPCFDDGMGMDGWTVEADMDILHGRFTELFSAVARM